MTDFTIMVENTSYMFVTGPNVVKTVTNEEVSSEELGGASTHSTKSGVTHLTAANDMICIDHIKKLLSYMPQNCEDVTPKLPFTLGDEIREILETIIPESTNQPYDIRSVIAGICDEDAFFEIHKDYAENIVVGFSRLAGRSIGIVANQPMSLAGVLDIDSSKKGARFTRFCDCFNIPLLVLVDVPGFLPGTDQEWNGIITNGAKLLYALSEATVPRVTVITRKAYGGAYDVMNSKHIGADMNFAWPTAEIAVMGGKGALMWLPVVSVAITLLDHRFELLRGVERDHAAGGDRYFLSSLRVTTRSLRLVPQLEVSEAGKLHPLTAFERRTYFLEE